MRNHATPSLCYCHCHCDAINWMTSQWRNQSRLPRDEPRRQIHWTLITQAGAPLHSRVSDTCGGGGQGRSGPPTPGVQPPLPPPNPPPQPPPLFKLQPSSSMNGSVRLSVCLSVCLWMVQCARPSVCLSVRPSHLFHNVPIIIGLMIQYALDHNFVFITWAKLDALTDALEHPTLATKKKLWVVGCYYSYNMFLSVK